MKTLEQTKRAISVGLITAARVVIVASTTLFCGVTAARADEPDNRIDWRWGRPGVMVVTNAPTAVTVTNIATTVATDVAGGVAENLFGPRVTALEGGTNNWNTAYSWGDHAGLYRAIGWVPSWGDLTDIPQDFPPSTHEHDYTTITNPPWLTSFTETDEIALSRVTVLEGKTNNWNTAYSWGDHAGLYKGIGWFPTWAEVTGKPDLFDWSYDSLTNKPATFPPSAHTHPYTDITDPPWLTEYIETDEIALSRVTVLEGKTNNWDTAYSWGNHAGLYKNVLWFPLWTEVTGKPDLFDWSYDSLTNVPAAFPPEAHQHDYTAVTNPPWLTEYTETDEIALAALADTNAILRAAITNEAALRSAHTADTENPHQITPAQIGAATTGELAAVEAGLAAYATTQSVAAVEAALAGYQSAAYWPPNATARDFFTFTTNVTASSWSFTTNTNGITITGYNIAGGTDVIIPDYINGWPVTEIGEEAFSPDRAGMYITSVKGGDNVTNIGTRAFYKCTNLKSVLFRNLTTLNERAFTYCGCLETVVFPNLQVVAGASPFSWCELLRDVEFEKLIHAGSILADCISLTNARLPNARTFGAAFYNCRSLQSIDISSAEMLGNSMFSECGLSTIKVPASVVYLEDAAFALATNTVSVYFDGDAPTIGNDTFYEVPENQVTIYVTNPQATGWGDRLGGMPGGMPVVRLPLYADEIYKEGLPVATEAHVAEQIAGKVDAVSGLASNLWLQGETIVSDSYTNLWWRNVYSNGWHWLVAYTNAPGGVE